jgi:hypothetical protein
VQDVRNKHRQLRMAAALAARTNPPQRPSPSPATPRPKQLSSKKSKSELPRNRNDKEEIVSKKVELSISS